MTRKINVRDKNIVKKYTELSFGGDIMETTRKSQEKKLKTNDINKRKRHIRWCLEKSICKLPMFSSSKMQ